MDGLRKELSTLIKENTFIKEEKPAYEPIIPVTAKSRAKAQTNGKLEKAKVRVCLRGDQQEELVGEATQCSIAGLRATHKVLASAVQKKHRVY